jgi:hypothetical protein
LYLTANEAVLALRQSAANSKDQALRTSVVRMKLVGASATAEPVGDSQLPGKSNYFIGNDPTKWRRDVPQFARVRYHDVYPGTDLVYYGNQGRLEYDFEVASGSDPKLVTLKFQGQENLRIDADGDLVLSVGTSDLRLHAPRVYQKFGTKERSVAGRFALLGKEKDEVGFELGDYDRSRSLVIDPVLTYSTYLGGSGNEACSIIAPIIINTIAAAPPGCPAIAVDAVGNAYIAGSTESTDFPIPSGTMPFQSTLNGTANVFIAKFTPSASLPDSLQAATYLGGNGIDYTAGVVVDAAGSYVIVAGTTNSSNFPTTSGSNNAAFQTTPVTGGNHVFVSKLDTTLHALMYSTYLSGNGADIASGLAIDPGGNAYVTGTTASTEVKTGFPSTLGAYQPAPASGSLIQFFVSKIDPNLSGSASLPYSTYFGGSNPPGAAGLAVGGGIAVDSSSNAYITGGTNFTDLPTLNPYQGTIKGGLDAFVTKINPAGALGTQLLYSTYLGGSGDDVGYGIAVDSSTNAYVTGSTTSADIVIPTGTTPFQGCLDDPGHQPPKCVSSGTNQDAFLAKLGTIPTGGGNIPLNYFTYLGGSGTDVGTGVAVDSLQGARIAGWTNSNPLATHNMVLQITYGGAIDGFAARIDTTATTSNAAGHYVTYLGGTAADMGTGVALDTQGSSYVTGETSSTDFPLANPFQSAPNGPSDAFVSKLGPVLGMTMTATGTPSPVGVGSQVSFAYKITNTGEFTNGVTFTDQLPASGATFVSATASPGTCGAPSGTPPTVLCNIGTLNAAAIATVTVIVTPVAPTIPGGSVVLGNSGSAGVGGSTLVNAAANVNVNDFRLDVAPATATVPAGVPATFTATVTPSANNGFPGSVSLSCGSGLPTGATCTLGSNNPIPNLNNGPQSSQLVINTTARVTTTTDLRHRVGTHAPLDAIWLPVSGLTLLGVGVGGKLSGKRRLLMGLILGGFFVLVLFQAGCGSSSHSTTTTGTPAGTYAVTVNATSGSATRSSLVTLVVQ